MGGAERRRLDKDIDLGRNALGFFDHGVVALSDDERHPLRPGRADRSQYMRQQRTARELVQNLGPIRAHALALASREDDGETGAFLRVFGNHLLVIRGLGNRPELA